MGTGAHAPDAAACAHRPCRSSKLGAGAGGDAFDEGRGLAGGGGRGEQRTKRARGSRDAGVIGSTWSSSGSRRSPFRHRKWIDHRSRSKNWREDRRGAIFRGEPYSYPSEPLETRAHFLEPQGFAGSVFWGHESRTARSTGGRSFSDDWS